MDARLLGGMRVTGHGYPWEAGLYRVKLRIVDHFGRAAVLDRRLRNKKIMKYFVLAESFGILTAKFEN